MPACEPLYGAQIYENAKLLCVVLILYLVWMCAAGASSCPPYKCLRTFLHKSLLYLPQIRQTDCVHILWDGMETDVADQLGIHDATSRM